MTLLSHFPAVGVSNTYILGPQGGGDAILVDPGAFDVSLLELIEDNDFNIRSVLVTHCHDNHIQGLRTLKRIYDATIFAGQSKVLDFPATELSGGDSFDTAGFHVDVVNAVGHSADSRVYRVGWFVFTGDILSAGRIGTSTSTWTRDLLISAIKTQILSLDTNLIVLPGHGPPTTLQAERNWNPDLRTVIKP